jgi:anti-anti-sigma factor
MTHYRLRVYSDAGYFPDKAVKSVMRRRVERRALRLEDEGFKTKLVAAPSTVRGPARVTAPRRRKTAPERRRRTVPEEFTIQRVREARRCTLILAGRLDLASASTLEEMIAGLCDDGTREVVLHLDGLTYLDTMGLRMLLLGRGLCAEHGLDFRLAPVGRVEAGAPLGERRSISRRVRQRMPQMRRGGRVQSTSR